jgi:hypothetical protein
VIRIAVVCALVVGVVAPAALAADPAPADFKNAARYCKALRSAKGVEAFRTEWGTNKNKNNAFGKCVSATNKAKAKKNAKDENENETESEAEATGTKSGTE